MSSMSNPSEGPVTLVPAQERCRDQHAEIPVSIGVEMTGCGKTSITIQALLKRREKHGADGAVVIFSPDARNLASFCGEIRRHGIEPFPLRTPKHLEAISRMTEEEIRKLWIVCTHSVLWESTKANIAFLRPRPQSSGRKSSRLSLAEAKASGHRPLLEGLVSDIVIDEAHHMKSKQAKATKAMWEFVRLNCAPQLAAGKRCWLIFLTATPIKKAATEMLTYYWIAGIDYEIAHHYEYKESTGKPVPVRVLEGSEEMLRSIVEKRLIRATRDEVFPPEALHPIHSISGIEIGGESQLHEAVADEAVRLRYVLDENEEPVLEPNGEPVINMALRAKWLSYIKFLANLPDKITPEIYDELQSSANDLAAAISPGMTGSTLPMQVWAYYQRATTKMMLPGVVDLIAEESKHGDGLVVFFIFNDALLSVQESLRERGVEAGTYYGQMKEDELVEARDDLAEGRTPVLLVNIKKGGEGIHFVPAKRTIIAQVSPTPAEMSQAENRIYRFITQGQTYHTRCIASIGGSMTRFERGLRRINEDKISEASIFGLEEQLLSEYVS